MQRNCDFSAVAGRAAALHRRQLHARAIGAVIALAAMVVGLSVAAPSAQAQDDLPPTPPSCPLDPPPGLACTPGPKEAFVFEAVDPRKPAGQVLNRCVVTLEGATPPDPYGNANVQFRTRNQCEQPLRAATVEAKLFKADMQTQIASGPAASCHALTATPCTTGILESRGESSGRPTGVYIQRAYVRLVLDEPGSPDPWVVVAGEPADTPTSCTPGGVEVRCHLKLAIPVGPAPDLPAPGDPVTVPALCFTYDMRKYCLS